MNTFGFIFVLIIVGGIPLSYAHPAMLEAKIGGDMHGGHYLIIDFRDKEPEPGIIEILYEFFESLGFL